MEEEKAAAYYEELTRNGQSAARFKHGLGFSSSSSNPSNISRSIIIHPPKNLLTFVKATSPPPKQSQQLLLSIHNKLTQPKNLHSPPPSSSSCKDRYRDRDSDVYRDGNRYWGRRIRSRSDYDGERIRIRRRSVSRSPDKNKYIKRGDVIQEIRKSSGIDYAKLIHGYAKMSPAERVKAKMKFQLSETAEKDAMHGMGSGWERFEFDKDAPLDDEEMEVADDDVALVKHIGQSFRFSAVEANRDDKIKAAHDEAMFGSSRVLPPIHTEAIIEQENESKSKEIAPATSLLSDKVITGQQGSWRDRARKA